MLIGAMEEIQKGKGGQREEVATVNRVIQVGLTMRPVTSEQRQECSKQTRSATTEARPSGGGAVGAKVKKYQGQTEKDIEAHCTSSEMEPL